MARDWSQKVDASEEMGRVEDDKLQVTLSDHASECFENEVKDVSISKLTNVVESGPRSYVIGRPKTDTGGKVLRKCGPSKGQGNLKVRRVDKKKRFLGGVR